MKKVLTTTSSFGKQDISPLTYLKERFDVVLNPYNRQLTTEEFIDLAKDCDGVIAGTEMITRQAMEQTPKLKVISRCGVGIDNVDINAAKALGIQVYNTPDAPTTAVAELTVALILDLSRQVSSMDAALKNGIWKKRMGSLIKGKKIAIIGMGRIGKAVSKRLTAFGTDIQYFDIEKKDVPYQMEPSFEKLLGWADVISLHCSLGDKIPLIGQPELHLMKKNALLINTSRGRLIDEKALFTALLERQIKGAALDVFVEEPYTGELQKLENVLLTPHIASSAEECRLEMELEAAKNLVKGLE